MGNIHPHFVQAQFRGHHRPVLVGIYDSTEAYMVHDAIAKLHAGQLGSVRTACPDVFSRLTLTATNQQLDIAAERNVDRRTCPRVYWEPTADNTSQLVLRYGGRPAYVTDCMRNQTREFWLYRLEFEDGKEIMVTEAELA